MIDSDDGNGGGISDGDDSDGDDLKGYVMETE